MSMNIQDITFEKSYRGKTDNSIAWSQFIEIFNTIWGKEFHHLPKYPQILGGIYAAWTDGKGTTFNTESLEEIKSAYQDKQTAEIFIRGNPNHAPKCEVVYICANAEIRVILRAKNKEKVNSILNLVKEYFPIEIPENYELNEDSKTFVVRLASVPSPIILDFKMSDETDNDMYYLFAVLYYEYIKNKNAPLSNNEILNRLKEYGISGEKLQRADFIKTTIKNLRVKINGKELLKAVISISNIRGKGYYLLVNI